MIHHMNRIYSVKKACRIYVRRVKWAKILSRNTQYSINSRGEKFSIRVLNSTKEALLLDKIKKNCK